jgi:hypothetical protein
VARDAQPTASGAKRSSQLIMNVSVLFLSMGLEITIHSRVNRWEKVLVAESSEELKALQLVFDGIFQFGEVQFDICRPQCAIKFG